ncbi:pep-cterm sorting domain-containing protein [Anaeramoeba ignava]|uniref:Pep-cterm sorting domain-containing protein n=1 Tax=Anaeramoeba ignava TaxID=1746090 RepID=A0A9Q0RGX4_ANAIG|nr:pep-cterm sorting domain-containing protein [Anaeramoeba ignava]
MNTNAMNTNTMNTNTMNTNTMNTNAMNTNLLNLPNNQLDALLSDECTIDLKALLKTEAALSDFTIICGKNLKEFRCHKLILSSRSQFFHSLFRQKDLEIINFAEFEYGIVDPVMGFLYTGEIKIPQQSFDSYHKLADKLILPKLKIKIEKDIQQSLNQDNLVDVYSKSKRISSDFLIQSCGDLLTQNIDQMIQSNQVQKINQHEVICFIEMMLLNKTTNKLKLIPGLVIEWFKYNNLKPQREYSKLHLKNLQIPFYKSIFQLLEHIQYLYPISDYQMYQIQKFSFFPFETVVEIYNHHKDLKKKTKELIQEKEDLTKDKETLTKEKEDNKKKQKEIKIKEKDVTKKEAELGKKETDLGKKETDLGKKETDLGKMEKKNAKEKKENQKKEKELTKKEAELGNKEQELTNQKQELIKKEKELLEREKDLLSRIQSNKVDIEKELKLLDDEFNKSDYTDGATLLHYFAQKKPINKDLFNHFIKSGVDWNKQDNNLSNNLIILIIYLINFIIIIEFDIEFDFLHYFSFSIHLSYIKLYFPLTINYDIISNIF